MGGFLSRLVRVIVCVPTFGDKHISVTVNITVLGRSELRCCRD